jgi:hypothetical protein
VTAVHDHGVQLRWPRLVHAPLPAASRASTGSAPLPVLWWQAALYLAHVAHKLGGDLHTHAQSNIHTKERRQKPTTTAPRRCRPRPRATCAPGTAAAARPCTCASPSNKMKPTGGFKSKRVEAGQGGTCERFARRTWGRGCPALHKAAGVTYATHLNCNTAPTVGELAPGSTSCTRPCR